MISRPNAQHIAELTLCDLSLSSAETDKLCSYVGTGEITAEMINCMGCRTDGIKTVYCDSLCPIRKCAVSKGFETCGECPSVDDCQIIAPITSTNAEARSNLKKEQN